MKQASWRAVLRFLERFLHEGITVVAAVPRESLAHVELGIWSEASLEKATAWQATSFMSCYGYVKL